MGEPLTLDFFCRSLLDPFFKIWEVLDNHSHPEHDNLISDLVAIDKSELEDKKKMDHIDFYIGQHENKDLARRTWIFISHLHILIARKRIDILNTKSLRPSPYNSINLNRLEINDNNLIDLGLLKTDGFGELIYNNFGYRICPTLSQDNSSYWTFKTIMELTRIKKIQFKIRLDPLIEIPLKEYSPMIQLMTIYGRPLNWHRIKNLRDDEFGRFLNAESSSEFTDYIWHPLKDQVHFTCEEIPRLNNCDQRGSRYFHSIFNKKNGRVVHCDGAIRIYQKDDLITRFNFHVKDSSVRKIGTRIKIFQTDNLLSQDDFIKLASSFFVWNSDLSEYFNSISL